MRRRGMNVLTSPATMAQRQSPAERQDICGDRGDMLYYLTDTRSVIGHERVVGESASPVAGWAGCGLSLGCGSMRRKE